MTHSPFRFFPTPLRGLVAAAVAALLLASCSGTASMLQTSDFAYSPQPLFVDGQHMVVEVMGQLPPKSVPRRALVTLTPCLFWEGGGLLGDSLTVQGERVEGMRQIVSYKRGGRVRLSGDFPYREGMERAALVVYVETREGDRLVSETSVPLDTGVNCTRMLLPLALAEAGRSASDPVVQNAWRAMLSGRMAVMAAQLDEVGGNAALLADILAQNYASARERLKAYDSATASAPKATALTAYLRALFGARTSDPDILRQGLQQLRQSGDTKLLNRARHDVEFRYMHEILDEIVP